MADPPNIETQIDCFLEQFKRSASKAMEERCSTTTSTVNNSINAVIRSRSNFFDAESPETSHDYVLDMARVGAAEKEASEVLHSLLSVERIEKQEVIVDRNENPSPTHTFQSNTTAGTDGTENESQIQWHTPVISSHSLFSAIDANSHFQQTIDDQQQVIWEGHTIQVESEQQHNNLNTIYTSNTQVEETPDSPKRGVKTKTPQKVSTKKKVPIKKKKKGALESGGSNDPTKLEDSAAQVKERFKRGCECQDESCFRGLNPESVYKHRLNIAELTKGEHDMYLMGVTMACLANPDTTVRLKERRRLRAQYVYQGRRVCLDAFLYLENCTHYQLKRIRKHVMTHGVAPRVHDDDDLVCEEIKMQNFAPQEPLRVNDVVDVLQPQYAIITGGKSKEGCPLITFPDNNNFHTLTDAEYQRLILYLTSVPSLQEADLGFHLIIDRRKDRWNSVKTVLLKISVYFPGLIHVVYVIRPASFLQKALSEVSNKLFKDEFKFRMIVLSTVEELYEYVDVSQLTPDLGGTLPYVHFEWIQQRIELEKFSEITQDVSNALDEFTKTINETEFPNNVDLTQQLLNRQSRSYSELKEEILAAAKHGEMLLCNIREKSVADNMNKIEHSADIIGNVFAVERLLVQLEETERTFDDFWQKHSTKLRHCLELRRFEQDFRELQINFDSHLKTVAEMTEIGETVARVDVLIREMNMFQKLCTVDIERAEEVISSGQQLMKIKNSCPIECVAPKCSELTRMRDVLTEKLSKRMDALVKCRDLMERVESANRWCTRGVELLTSQKIDKCQTSHELAEKSLQEVQQFISSSDEFIASNPQQFKNVFYDSVTPETKALVTQVLQRIDDVSLMCEKRMASLKKLTVRQTRPVQTVLPEPAVPRQPPGGAPVPNKIILKKANTIPKMENTHSASKVGNNKDSEKSPSPPICDIGEDDVNKIKRGHVLTELLATERVYVAELYSIIQGYIKAAESKEMQPFVPPGFSDKLDVIFGNLDEIHKFHSEVFLKDLETCLSSTDLVALCFVQRRENFYRLYSFYCQNIPRSEQLRDSLADANIFFQMCQQKLGHKLPLAAYLLKPVQRITKYQLLLKDLLQYSDGGKCHKELQQALDCMLVVLKCVNDSMHQISITGFPADLSQQGDLLLQGSFSVWTECKRDLRLRIKPMHRHIFLYQKVILFCKPAAKTAHNEQTYHFKHCLKMSQIGLTESVKGDAKKFEVWLQGRQEVHTIQASTVEQKQTWVNEIKRVLLNQLEELKGERIKQYQTVIHRPLRQTTSWEKQQRDNVVNTPHINVRTVSCDDTRSAPVIEDEAIDCTEVNNWYSDGSNSEDEESQPHPPVPSGHYVALADYCAVGNSEVSMREGDVVELLKVGCAGWWFVKVIGSVNEGWAPAAYLENLHRKTSRSTSRSQDRLNDH